MHRAAHVPATAVTNVHACLVHEAPDCVTDLVMNLRCLDPESEILLYDGSAHGQLLDAVRLPGDNVHVHPRPRPMRWGALHDFALDCLRYALAELPFDAMTIVDSDQLLLRPGYSQRLTEVLADTLCTGCLVNAVDPQPRPAADGPVADAWRERKMWQPYLRRFASGEELFPQWTFWPGTVFTAEGVRRLLELWDDPELAWPVAGTGITATEEIILPTLVALSGASVAVTPFRRDCVQFRRSYSISELERVARLDDAFWLHPAPRILDDPVRAWVRKRYAGYRYRPSAFGGDARTAALAATPLVSCLMPTGAQPLLASLAIRQFVRQTYQNRKLIVVDDGDHPVEDLIAGLPTVTYLRLAHRTGRAAKRNVAASHARGQVLAHWDVDGWSGPTRLADQKRELLNDATDVCGLRAVLFYDPPRRRAWRYACPPHRHPWLADATLCYRRELWEDNPFPETVPAWQEGFYWPNRARRVAALDAPPCYVALLPPQVLPSPDAPGSWWKSVPLSAVHRVLGDDTRDYELVSMHVPAGEAGLP
ncbi:MAG: glycosyltransferase family 2 protein [Actinomycetota bacterium]|nr:glycosyltransferase family 2 protein [Actinomycetota bacterium]